MKKYFTFRVDIVVHLGWNHKRIINNNSTNLDHGKYNSPQPTYNLVDVISPVPSIQIL